ncbi:MAG TPA: response regulator [Gemmatimonadales bacterium]|nr:response regulator [Gemmatimonadales bacterium]
METVPLIAIVDDEPSVRVALGRLCRAYGLRTGEFASVRDLVASLAEQRPDCVVLDLQLPDCEGLDADVWLRDRGVDLPVIIITGRDDVKRSSESVVLPKPVDAKTLFAAIRTALEAR